jgi:hypothetical protein
MMVFGMNDNIDTIFYTKEISDHSWLLAYHHHRDFVRNKSIDHGKLTSYLCSIAFGFGQKIHLDT